jgi:hypothetical protein
VIFKDYYIQINEKRKKLVEVTTKDAYWHFTEEIAERPTSETKWQEETGLNFDKEDWAAIYTNIYSVTNQAKLISFHYKITHRTLACKKNLLKWKIKEDAMCELCKTDIDNIEHHLVACPTIIIFWNNFFNWWKATMSMTFPVDTYDIIFGISNLNKDDVITNLNYMLLQGTYFIYQNRQMSKTPEIYEFLVQCKKGLNIMEINMANKGQEKKFEKIWAPLSEIL